MHSLWDFPSGRNQRLNSAPRCDVTTYFVYGWTWHHLPFSPLPPFTTPQNFDCHLLRPGQSGRPAAVPRQENGSTSSTLPPSLLYCLSLRHRKIDNSLCVTAMCISQKCNIAAQFYNSMGGPTDTKLIHTQNVSAPIAHSLFGRCLYCQKVLAKAKLVCKNPE